MLTGATRKTMTQRSCGVSFSRDTSLDTVLSHVLEGPYLSRGVGLDDLQWSLPTWPILWFCNMLDLTQKWGTEMVRGAAACHVSRESERIEIHPFLHFRGWHRTNSNEFYSDSSFGQLTSVLLRCHHQMNQYLWNRTWCFLFKYTRKMGGWSSSLQKEVVKFLPILGSVTSAVSFRQGAGLDDFHRSLPN